MSTHKQTINNGSYAEFPAGNFFQIISASNLEVDIEFIKNNSVIASAKEVSDSYFQDFNVEGKNPNDWGFDKVKVTNNSGTNITNFKCEITKGKGGTNNLGGSVTVSSATPTAISTAADQTVTTTKGSIAASNSSRKEIIIEADLANTNPIIIGDTNITTTRGLRVYPGQTMVLNTTAQIFALVAAGTEKVFVSEI